MIDYSIKEVIKQWVAILTRLMNIHGTTNRGSNSDTVAILTCDSTLELEFHIDSSKGIEFIITVPFVAFVPLEPPGKIAMEICRLNLNQRTSLYLKGILEVY